MKQEDFDLLSQYIDDELSQEESLRVKQRLLSEPEFNKQYRELMALENNVRDAMPGFENEPMGDELAALLKLDDLESKRNDSQTNDSRSNIRQINFVSTWRNHIALAASVMLVAVLGVFVINNADQSQTGLPLQDKLFSSLESNESWSSNDGLEFMIVQSYLGGSDELCREYFARDAEHSEHGVSCLDNGSWEKQVFELKYNQSGDHYVTASDEGGVDDFIKSKSLKSLSSEEEAQKLK